MKIILVGGGGGRGGGWKDSGRADMNNACRRCGIRVVVPDPSGPQLPLAPKRRMLLGAKARFTLQEEDNMNRPQHHYKRFVLTAFFNTHMQ